MGRTLALATAAVAAATSLAGLTGTAEAARGVANIGPGPSSNRTGVACVQAAVGARVDGQFGQETYTKVKRFQRASGLAQDGIVGPNTGNAVIRKNNSQGYTGCYRYVPTTY